MRASTRGIGHVRELTKRRGMPASTSGINRMPELTDRRGIHHDAERIASGRHVAGLPAQRNAIQPRRLDRSGNGSCASSFQKTPDLVDA